MTNSCIVTVNISIKPEYVEKLVSQLPGITSGTTSFEGFQKIEMVQQADDPTKVLFVEWWDSAEAYDKYISWRMTTDQGTDFVSMLSADPVYNFWPKEIFKSGPTSK